MQGKIKRSKTSPQLGKNKPKKKESPPTVQQAAKWLRTADGAVRRAAAANNRPNYEYSKKAQMWAAGELDKATKRALRKTSKSKRYQNQE